MEVIEIFCEAIYKDNINLSIEEIEYLTNSRSNGEHPNQHGNSSSINKNILDFGEMVSLKDKIQLHLDYYVNEIIGSSDVKLHLTQSWLNFNDKETSHHTHNHSNSIVSGVLYVTQAPADFVIFKDKSQRLQPNLTKKTKYNSRTVSITPKLGDLILLPSHLLHGVQQNKTDITRISLAFNTFYKGSVGNKINLTYLEIL